MKKIFCLTCAFMLVLSSVGCSEEDKSGNIVKNGATIEVEYGDSFSVPVQDGYTVSVKDALGENVRLQYGSFIPSVGEYTLIYTGKKDIIMTLVCRDTIAPEVYFNTKIIDVAKGAEVILPTYSIKDKSVVTNKIVVMDNDGNEITPVDNKITAIASYYEILLTSTDAYQNVSYATARINVHDTFYDEDLSSNSLFTFDKTEYINNVYLIDGVDCFSGKIVNSGYPAIVNEAEGNGVLKLSTDVNYGEVYISFVVPVREFRFSDTHSITLRVSADRDTDWVKVKNSNKEEGGAVYRLKANEWYDLTVDPILMGYNTPQNNLILTARANAGLNLFVDYIKCEENKADSNYVKGQETFDNDTYLARTFQNIYHFEHSDNAKDYNAPNSLFEITEKGYLGEFTNRKVLKVTTTERYGGFTYMFSEAIDASAISHVVVKMSHDYQVGKFYMGALQGNYKSSKYFGSFTAGELRKINSYVLSGQELLSNTDGIVTGIWLAVVDDARTGNTLYIDSIEVIYK